MPDGFIEIGADWRDEGASRSIDELQRQLIQLNNANQQLQALNASGENLQTTFEGASRGAASMSESGRDLGDRLQKLTGQLRDFSEETRRIQVTARDDPFERISFDASLQRQRAIAQATEIGTGDVPLGPRFQAIDAQETRRLQEEVDRRTRAEQQATERLESENAQRLRNQQRYASETRRINLGVNQDALGLLELQADEARNTVNLEERLARMRGDSTEQYADRRQAIERMLTQDVQNLIRQQLDADARANRQRLRHAEDFASRINRIRLARQGDDRGQLVASGQDQLRSIRREREDARESDAGLNPEQEGRFAELIRETRQTLNNDIREFDQQRQRQEEQANRRRLREVQDTAAQTRRIQLETAGDDVGVLRSRAAEQLRNLRRQRADTRQSDSGLDPQQEVQYANLIRATREKLNSDISALEQQRVREADENNRRRFRNAQDTEKQIRRLNLERGGDQRGLLTLQRDDALQSIRRQRTDARRESASGLDPQEEENFARLIKATRQKLNADIANFDEEASRERRNSNAQQRREAERLNAELAGNQEELVRIQAATERARVRETLLGVEKRSAAEKDLNRQIVAINMRAQRDIQRIQNERVREAAGYAEQTRQIELESSNDQVGILRQQLAVELRLLEESRDDQLITERQFLRRREALQARSARRVQDQQERQRAGQQQQGLLSRVGGFLGGAGGGAFGNRLLGVGIGGGVGGVIFGTLLNQIQQFSTEVVSLSGRVQLLRSSFENLTARAGQDAIEMFSELQVATRGTISEFQSLEIANLALNSQIRPLVENFPDIVANITDVSTALGRDVPRDLQRITLAISKQEQELLDELGIVARAESAYIKYSDALNISVRELTDTQRATAFAIQVIDQLQAKAREAGQQFTNLASNTANSAVVINRVSAAYADFQTQLGDSLSPAVIELFAFIDVGLRGIIDFLDEAEARQRRLNTSFITQQRVLDTLIDDTAQRSFQNNIDELKQRNEIFNVDLEIQRLRQEQVSQSTELSSGLSDLDVDFGQPAATGDDFFRSLEELFRVEGSQQAGPIEIVDEETRRLFSQILLDSGDLLNNQEELEKVSQRLRQLFLQQNQEFISLSNSANNFQKIYRQTLQEIQDQDDTISFTERLRLSIFDREQRPVGGEAAEEEARQRTEAAVGERTDGETVSIVDDTELSDLERLVKAFELVNAQLERIRRARDEINSQKLILAFEGQPEIEAGEQIANLERLQREAQTVIDNVAGSTTLLSEAVNSIRLADFLSPDAFGDINDELIQTRDHAMNANDSLIGLVERAEMTSNLNLFGNQETRQTLQAIGADITEVITNTNLDLNKLTEQQVLTTIRNHQQTLNIVAESSQDQVAIIRRSYDQRLFQLALLLREEHILERDANVQRAEIYRQRTRDIQTEYRQRIENLEDFIAESNQLLLTAQGDSIGAGQIGVSQDVLSIFPNIEELLQQGADVERVTQAVTDRLTAIFLDYSNERRSQRRSILQELFTLEATNSDNIAGLTELEHQQRLSSYKQLIQGQMDAEELFARFRTASRAQADANLEEQQTQARERAIQESRERQEERVEEEIRIIRLIFSADTQEVETAAQLGAFSLGLFVNQLRNIEPVSRDAQRAYDEAVRNNDEFAQIIAQRQIELSMITRQAIDGLLDSLEQIVTGIFSWVTALQDAQENLAKTTQNIAEQSNTLNEIVALSGPVDSGAIVAESRALSGELVNAAQSTRALRQETGLSNAEIERATQGIRDNLTTRIGGSLSIVSDNAVSGAQNLMGVSSALQQVDTSAVTVARNLVNTAIQQSQQLQQVQPAQPAQPAQQAQPDVTGVVTVADSLEEAGTVAANTVQPIQDMTDTASRFVAVLPMLNSEFSDLVDNISDSEDAFASAFSGPISLTPGFSVEQPDVAGVTVNTDSIEQAGDALSDLIDPLQDVTDTAQGFDVVAQGVNVTLADGITILENAGGAVVGFFGTLSDAVIGGVSDGADHVGGAIVGFTDPLQGVTDTAQGLDVAAQGVNVTLADGITILENAGGAVVGFFGTLSDAVIGGVSDGADHVGGAIVGFTDPLQGVTDTAQGLDVAAQGVNVTLADGITILENAGGAVVGFFGTLSDAVIGGVSDGADHVGGAIVGFTDPLQGVTDTAQGLDVAAQGVNVTLADGITILENAGGAVVGFFGTLADAVIGGISDGVDHVGGAIVGFTDPLQDVTDTAQGLDVAAQGVNVTLADGITILENAGGAVVGFFGTLADAIIPRGLDDAPDLRLPTDTESSQQQFGNLFTLIGEGGEVSKETSQAIGPLIANLSGAGDAVVGFTDPLQDVTDTAQGLDVAAQGMNVTLADGITILENAGGAVVGFFGTLADAIIPRGLDDAPDLRLPTDTESSQQQFGNLFTLIGEGGEVSKETGQAIGPLIANLSGAGDAVVGFTDPLQDVTDTVQGFDVATQGVNVTLADGITILENAGGAVVGFFGTLADAVIGGVSDGVDHVGDAVVGFTDPLQDVTDTAQGLDVAAQGVNVTLADGITILENAGGAVVGFFGTLADAIIPRGLDDAPDLRLPTDTESSQQQFGNLFTLIGEGGEVSKETSQAIGPLIANLSGVGEAVVGFTDPLQGVTDIAQGFDVAAQGMNVTLANGIPILENADGAVVGFFGRLADAVIGGVSDGADHVGDAIVGFTDPLQDVTDTAQGFDVAAQGMNVTLANGIPILENADGAVVGFFGRLADAVIGGVSDGADHVGDAIVGFTDPLQDVTDTAQGLDVAAQGMNVTLANGIPILENADGAVVGFFGRLADAVIGGVSDGVDHVGDAIVGFTDPLQDVTDTAQGLDVAAQGVNVTLADGITVMENLGNTFADAGQAADFLGRVTSGGILDFESQLPIQVPLRPSGDELPNVAQLPFRVDGIEETTTELNYASVAFRNFTKESRVFTDGLRLATSSVSQNFQSIESDINNLGQNVSSQVGRISTGITIPDFAPPDTSFASQVSPLLDSSAAIGQFESQLISFEQVALNSVGTLGQFTTSTNVLADTITSNINVINSSAQSGAKGAASIASGFAQFAGIASVAAGSFGIFSSVVSIFDMRAQAAQRATRELNEALEDTVDLQGDYARELQGLRTGELSDVLRDIFTGLLQLDYDNALRRIDGIRSGPLVHFLETYLQDFDADFSERFAAFFKNPSSLNVEEIVGILSEPIFGYANIIDALDAIFRTELSGDDLVAAQGYLERIRRAAEQYGRTLSDTVFTINDALDVFNFRTDIFNIEDPTEQLNLLQDLLEDSGVMFGDFTTQISNGLIGLQNAGNLDVDDITQLFSGFGIVEEQVATFASNLVNQFGNASAIPGGSDENNAAIRTQTEQFVMGLNLATDSIGEGFRLANASLADLGTITDALTNTGQLTLSQRRNVVSQIFRLIREQEDVEIQARQDYADAVIAEIERQRQRVLDAIQNEEDAQRSALQRAIALQFDVQEASLRAELQPQFAGAGGDEAQLTLLRENAERRIESLRSDEANVTEMALNELTEAYDEQRDDTNRLFDGFIEATQRAAEDLSTDFDTALTREFNAWIEEYKTGVESGNGLTQATNDILNMFIGEGGLAEGLVGEIDTSNFVPVVTGPPIPLPITTPMVRGETPDITPDNPIIVNLTGQQITINITLEDLNPTKDFIIPININNDNFKVNNFIIDLNINNDNFDVPGTFSIPINITNTSFMVPGTFSIPINITNTSFMVPGTFSIPINITNTSFMVPGTFSIPINITNTSFMVPGTFSIPINITNTSFMVPGTFSIPINITNTSFMVPGTFSIPINITNTSFMVPGTFSIPINITNTSFMVPGTFSIPINITNTSFMVPGTFSIPINITNTSFMVPGTFSIPINITNTSFTVPGTFSIPINITNTSFMVQETFSIPINVNNNSFDVGDDFNIPIDIDNNDFTVTENFHFTLNIGNEDIDLTFLGDPISTDIDGEPPVTPTELPGMTGTSDAVLVDDDPSGNVTIGDVDVVIPSGDAADSLGLLVFENVLTNDLLGKLINTPITADIPETAIVPTEENPNPTVSVDELIGLLGQSGRSQFDTNMNNVLDEGDERQAFTEFISSVRKLLELLREENPMITEQQIIDAIDQGRQNAEASASGENTMLPPRATKLTVDTGLDTDLSNVETDISSILAAINLTNMRLVPLSLFNPSFPLGMAIASIDTNVGTIAGSMDTVTPTPEMTTVDADMTTVDADMTTVDADMTSQTDTQAEEPMDMPDLSKVETDISSILAAINLTNMRLVPLATTGKITLDIGLILTDTNTLVTDIGTISTNISTIAGSMDTVTPTPEIPTVDTDMTSQTDTQAEEPMDMPGLSDVETDISSILSELQTIQTNTANLISFDASVLDSIKTNTDQLNALGTEGAIAQHLSTIATNSDQLNSIAESVIAFVNSMVTDEQTTDMPAGDMTDGDMTMDNTILNNIDEKLGTQNLSLNDIAESLSVQTDGDDGASDMSGFVADVSQIRSDIGSLSTSLNPFPIDGSQLLSDLGTISSNTDSIDSHAASISQNVGNFEAAVSAFNIGIQDLKSDTESMSETLKSIESLLANLEQSIDVGGITITIDNAGGDVDEETANDLADTVIDRITSELGRNTKLRTTIVNATAS